MPLPDRLRIHEVIIALWEDNGPYARSCLLEIINQVPLRYGPWRALKRIFKEAEAREDIEVFGSLAARIDLEQGTGEITRRTIGYLRRRAWRYLRRTAQTRPACYADAAAEVLVHYENPRSWDDQRALGQTWVFNQIIYRESSKYNRSRFFLKAEKGKLIGDRCAFIELWRRSPRPLFGLLERARSEIVRQFAANRLEQDFRAALREVEPNWVARLISVDSFVVANFVVWMLNNVPKIRAGRIPRRSACTRRSSGCSIPPRWRRAITPQSTPALMPATYPWMS